MNNLLNKLKKLFKKKVPESFQSYKIGSTIFVKDISDPLDPKIRVGYLRKIVDESHIKIFIPSYAMEYIVYYDGVNWILEQVE